MAPARAQDALVTFKSLSPELALDLAARGARPTASKRGYQTAVAVVDRFGDAAGDAARPLCRGAHPDDGDRQGLDRGQLPHQHHRPRRSPSKEGTPQSGVRNLAGAVVLGGGMMIEAGGSMVGGVGVSGAPGGDADDACAKAGIEAVRDKLDF